MIILDASILGVVQGQPNQLNQQITQQTVALQKRLLAAIASGNTQEQQDIQARLDRLTTLNRGPIQLPQNVRQEYQQSLQQITEQAAPLRMQLLQAIVRGDNRAAENIQLRLGKLDAIYNQTQRFLGVQNPTGVPLTQAQRTQFKKSLQPLTQQIVSLEDQLVQASINGDDQTFREITMRLTNVKMILGQTRRFLEVQNPTGTQQ